MSNIFNTKSEYEKKYEKLSEMEKNITHTTCLSIEDIEHYESFLNRKLSERELKIAGLLKNNGLVLEAYDFNTISKKDDDDCPDCLYRQSPEYGDLKKHLLSPCKKHI